MDLDEERRLMVARNQAALARFGVTKAAEGLREVAAATKNRPGAGSGSQEPAAKKPRGSSIGAAAVPIRAVRAAGPVRRSQRIAGAPAPPMVEMDDFGNPLLAATEVAREERPGDVDQEDGECLTDLLANDLLERLRAEMAPREQLSEQQRAALEEAGGGSAGAFRGRDYDSVVGMSCHFCRQKTLCAEKDCLRCRNRSASEPCIGKSACSRCHTDKGVFCKACLLVRYGEKMSDVRQDASWLCPHCREQEDGGWEEHGRFCNSSFCMRRKKFVPTGIAFHQALSMGFPSVAHLVQAAYLLYKRRGQQKHSAGTQQVSGTAAAGEGDAGAALADGAVAAAGEAAPMAAVFNATATSLSKEEACVTAADGMAHEELSMRARRAALRQQHRVVKGRKGAKGGADEAGKAVDGVEAAGSLPGVERYDGADVPDGGSMPLVAAVGVAAVELGSPGALP